MKTRIIALMMAMMPACGMMAQKITLGSCTTKDGGQYKGEMVAGKPHGKGNVLYPNGDIYEGEYVKGKRQGHGVYTFSDGEKYDGEWMLQSDLYSTQFNAAECTHALTITAEKIVRSLMLGKVTEKEAVQMIDSLSKSVE